MQNFKKNTETLKISHPPLAESLLIPVNSYFLKC